MTCKSSYEVFSLTFWRMKTSYDDLRAFPCYKISETTSLFAPYEVFPLHQDIFSSEGLVWNLFGLELIC